MKNLIHNYQQLDHTITSTIKPTSRSLVTLMKEQLTIEDQIDLGLIRNPIIDPTKVINQIKHQLECYDDIQDECGINYDGGTLLADDEPTQDELIHATDDIKPIKEQLTPQTKRNNFRVVESQRNNLGHYTREILANGGERIITDDELQDNPYFEYKHNLSMARENGEYETKGNEIKAKREQSQRKRWQSTSHSDELEQCFVKVNGKLFGDAFTMFNSRFNKLDIEQMESSSHCLLECLSKETYPIYDYTYVINRLMKENTAFNKIYTNKNSETKIKIVNTNLKVLAEIK